VVLIFGLALFIAMMGVAASARAATARDAAYNLVLDRRKMKITPCNADIAMMAATIMSGRPVPVPNTPSR